MINYLLQFHGRHKGTAINFLWRAIQIVGQQGITFLIFILCAKNLSTYEFGIYNYILAIVLFLVMFSDFGISTATSRYVAEYSVTDKDKLRAVLFNSMTMVFGAGFRMSVLLLILQKVN